MPRSLPSGPSAASPARPDLASLDRPALEALFEAAQIQPFHARQVYRWIHKRGITDPAAMTDLAQPLRERLAQEFSIETPALVTRDISSDGTQKFLFDLSDKRRIESVFIPDTPALTFCISSQVGCAMDCAFCLTGKMGFVRNLTAGEIVGQVRVLASSLDLLDTPINIVLMGMGEPLHNYDAVMQALRMLTDAQGLAIPARRITLSTVGLVPGIERLMRESLVPNLAISLHGTTDEQRTAIVPINKKYPLDELLAACRRIPLKRRDRITFEYVLLDSANDTPEDARRLVRLLSQLKAKVNLIPLNAAPGIPFDRPSDARVNRFAAILAEHGMTVSVRKSRGRDIRAACGQLIVDGQKPAPAQRIAALIDTRRL